MEGEEPEIEEIDLPPQEMWGKLMEGQPAAEGAAFDVGGHRHQPVPSAPAAAKPEVAELVFLGDRSTTVELDHPFVWDGQEIREITIRRLTLGEVQDLLARPAGAKLMLFDIYAVMTGLPVGVLRALDDDDGQVVTDKAYSFLPRSLRTGDG